MNQKINAVIVAVFCGLFALTHSAYAQGTAFTYQGRLNDNGALANGSYDIAFSLYLTNLTGAIYAGPVTNVAVAVTNGLFTTTVDFGPDAFVGGSNWLQVAVSTNAADNFFPLSPRQRITPVPYALYAVTAANASSVAAANISGQIPLGQLPPMLVTNGSAGVALTGTFAGNYGGSFYGSGAGLVGVNAATLNGMGATNFWQIGGNSNTTAGVNYLGTADLQPLELHVNGQRALRMEYGTESILPGYGFSPNIIGGSFSNSVGDGGYGNTGNFIGGGGTTNYPQQILGAYSAIVGGLGNVVQGFASTAMGQQNNVNGNYGTAMGIGNSVGGYGDTAIGGNLNSSGGAFSVAMGNGSSASGTYSMALGSYANSTQDGTFVWADDEGLFNWFSSTTTNQFLIRAQNGVGINTNNPAGAALSVNGNTTVAGNIVASSVVMASALAVTNATVSGLFISGTGTGTAEPPSPSGLVVRRINSASSSLISNSVVAVSSDGMTLVRDGTYAGFQIKYPASPGFVTIASMGMDTNGVARNFYTFLPNPTIAGTVQIYSNSQNVAHFECTFGVTFVSGQPLTQVVLSRYGTDYYWSGNIITTYNQ